MQQTVTKHFVEVERLTRQKLNTTTLLYKHTHTHTCTHAGMRIHL